MSWARASCDGCLARKLAKAPVGLHYPLGGWLGLSLHGHELAEGRGGGELEVGDVLVRVSVKVRARARVRLGLGLGLGLGLA